MKAFLKEIILSSKAFPIIFPVHPRTAKNLENLGLNASNQYLIEPLGYLEFNYLVKNVNAIITDSGGIKEETTGMSISCISLRNNTERPETIAINTNELIGTNPAYVAPAYEKLFAGNWKKGGIPPLWDGKTGEKIVNHLKTIF